MQGIFFLSLAKRVPVSVLDSPCSYSRQVDPVDSDGGYIRSPLEYATSLTDRILVDLFETHGMYSSRMLTFYFRY